MAVTTPRRRRRRAPATPVGRESWEIVQDGRVLRTSGHSADHALVLAQTDIQKEEEPTEYIVRLNPLFGEPDEFYRVVLDKDDRGRPVVETFRLR